MGRGEILQEVRVKWKDGELVRAHCAAHHLHDEDFVIESVFFVEA